MKKDDKKLSIRQSNIVSKTLYDKSISATSYKLLRYGFFLLTKDFKENIFTYTCTFTISEFCDCLGIERGGTTDKAVFSALDELTNSKILIKIDEKNYRFILWLQEATREDSNIKLTFNPTVLNIALGQIKNYSFLELNIIGKLKSFYSLRIYELVKSFYNTLGKYGNKQNEWKTEEYSIEYLKDFFGIEKTAYQGRNNNFIMKCIRKPIDEINIACKDLNFVITYETIKGPNNSTKAIKFVGLQKVEMTYSKTDSIEDKTVKSDKEDAAVELLNYKKKYKNWDELKRQAIEWEIKNSGSNFIRDCHSDFIQDLKTIEFIKDTIEVQPELFN